MKNRFKDADNIWNGGASNPRGVARALVDAIDSACEEGRGSAGAKDAAVQMILDHLCFLCGMPQPSFGRDWSEVMKEVERRKDETQ